MSNPHLYLLQRSLRTRTSINAVSLMAVRGGGGGHWHRPDPKLPKLYNFTRRYRLEDINTTIYHEFAPEYHMHLHSQWVQNAKQGLALVFFYCLFILFPGWCLANYVMRLCGSNLYPVLRPGKDHEHMAPRLIKHLKANNYEDKEDFLGRRTAYFYKNWCRQEMSLEFKPASVLALESHGFKF